MKVGLNKGKAAESVNKAGKIGLGIAVAQIIGIGLVAGGALIAGTNSAMKKLTKSDKKEIEEKEE